MMSEYRNPALEQLFRESAREFEGEAITERVMARTRNRLFALAAAGISLSLIAVLVGWYLFAGPLLDFAVLVSQFLTHPLLDLGEGWLALVFMPVNNFASISVLLVKGLLTAWKKLTGAALIR
ncbi:MAG: hypothetical protein V2I79_11380 [Xanthomonadales bacterium]|jgi:hypothetical protein|nr:hypothetical protein [Xanthomonadales bacterium]